MLSRLAIPVLFCLSGFAGLVYEVLWLKELKLVFGSTAQAAATTLAVFFLGLAAGGHWWGRRAATLTNALRVYGYLEAGIACSALFYLGLSKAYRWLYEPVYTAFGDYPALLLCVKFLLAAVVLFPASFLMGGTFPVLGQHWIRESERLGRSGSFLYAINTIGAASGALAAGFYLPRVLGFRGSYLFAIALSLGIGIVAWALSRGCGTVPVAASAATGKIATPAIMWLLALVSGFLALGLEVVWTRMFAQALQNSVYTFAAILVCFLVALGLGAVVANRLCLLRADPRSVIFVLLTLSGITVALTPFAFYYVTSGMSYSGDTQGWGPYLVAVFTDIGLVLLVPGILIGSVLPYLLRAVQGTSPATGAAIGKLLALNTLGGVFGAVCAGFLLLPSLGMWGSARLLALVYLLLALAVAQGSSKTPVALRILPVAGALLLFTWLDATRLPLVRLNTDRNERLVQAWEGVSGVVAVIEQNGSLNIKVNNHYRLGGTGAMETELNQTLIPLISHPHPEKLFFLGLGTGISAGAATLQPAKEIVVCELMPEVIEAARLHFSDAANGLFTDPRTTVLAEDGRNRLAGSPERFDAIIADLFIPWRSGAGSLYTLEHFETVKSRLRPGGIFVQWLPLYQVSQSEFFTIARTMLHVFPQVVLWRGEFRPNRPLLALIGSAEERPLGPDVIVQRGRYVSGNDAIPADVVLAVTLPFYAGNLSATPGLLPPGPLNTDDRPVIEYGAPRTSRMQEAGDAQWFRSLELAGFYDALWREVPPEEDPYLGWLSSEELGFVRAGLDYYKHATFKELGQEAKAEQYLEAFRSKVPVQFVADTSASGADAGVTE